MKLSVKKFAEITGVSVRTLHYYDEIDLLKPDFTDEFTGYRYYGKVAFIRMQEILFYRELDFTLKEIKEIISSHDYNKKKALSMQKNLLILKKRLERLVEAIDKAQEGELALNFEAFNKNEIEKARGIFKQEVTLRWGKTVAFLEYENKTSAYSIDDWSNVKNGLNTIIIKFNNALKSGYKPTSPGVITLVEKLQSFITQTQYTCTNEILASLGEMYVADDRFKNNINKAGGGTAEFINEAIKEYCKMK